MLDGAAYPYKLSRPITLDRISHGNDGCFTTEQLYQWRFVTVNQRHFPPDPLTPEGIRLTAGGVGLSTGYHTHSKA